MNLNSSIYRQSVTNLTRIYNAGIKVMVLGLMLGLPSMFESAFGVLVRASSTISTFGLGIACLGILVSCLSTPVHYYFYRSRIVE